MAPSSQGRTQLTRAKRSPWYALVIYAAFCFGIAGYSYSQITALETSGGSIKIPVLLMLPYEVAGKWGLVGILGAIGAYSLALGAVRAFGGQSPGRVNFVSEDPEWARRMREEAPPAPEPVPARRSR